MRNSSCQRNALARAILPFHKPVLLRIGGLYALSAILLLAAAAPAQAANKRDPNKEALRRMQMQVKQVEDEKAAIEQDKALLSKQLDTLQKKSGELISAAARANQRKTKLEKEIQTLQQDQSKAVERVAQLNKELGESQLALRDTRQNLQQETNLKQRLEQSLSTGNKNLEICETKNQKLYQYHVELINRAQNRGSLDVLLEAEPVLGFKRVEIENLLEEYRDKVDAQKINRALPTEAKSK